VAAGRWQRLYPGIFAIHTGVRGQETRIWAALLYTGPDAVVAGRSALWLAGALPPSTQLAVIDIVIPEQRRVRAQPRLIIHRRSDLARATAPWPPPSRLRTEEALLDVAHRAEAAAEVVSLIIGAVQRRATTAGDLAGALERRSRVRRRALIVDLLADVADGVQSPLELRYLRRVERAHGLPPAQYNHRDVDSRGQVRYRDARYPTFVTIVELDGRESHPRERAFRDRHRDNRAAREGLTTLRYGWSEIASDACAVAAEVAAVLRAAGWDGRPQRCGPSCPIGRHERGNKERP
jgi:hypothetical protein